MTEPWPCDLCGSTKTKPVTTVTRFSEPFGIVRCADCGLVRMDPMPSPADLACHYDADYYAGVAEYAYADERSEEAAARTIYAARIREIESRVGVGRLLDVGCAFGLLLDEARRRGWQVQGVEIAEESASHATGALSLPVARVPLTEADFEPGTFDAITMIELIEHLRDPVETMEAAMRALRPGGILVVQTADISSLKARLSGARWEYFLPGHVHYFTRATLARAARRAGLDVETIYSGDELGARAKWEREMLRRGSAPYRMLRGAVASTKHTLRRARIGGLTLGGMVLYARRPGGVT